MRYPLLVLLLAGCAAKQPSSLFGKDAVLLHEKGVISFNSTAKDAVKSEVFSIDENRLIINFLFPHTEETKSWPIRVMGAGAGGLKCGLCVKQGKKSHVYPGGCLTTLMSCLEYWNEDGVFVSEDCNTTTCKFTCSNGHWFHFN